MKTERARKLASSDMSVRCAGKIFLAAVMVCFCTAQVVFARSGTLYGFEKPEFVSGTVEISENGTTLILTGFSSVYADPMEIYLTSEYDRSQEHFAAILNPGFIGDASFDLAEGSGRDFDMVVVRVPGWATPAGLGILRGGGDAVYEPETKASMSAKEKDILRLLDLTVPRENLEEMVQLMIVGIQASVPPNSIPADFMKELGKKMMDMDMWYADVYIPLYEKYYNHEEILALIEFYETPVGRRIIEVQPQLAAESTLMGMEKGQQMAMEVMQKIKGETQ